MKFNKKLLGFIFSIVFVLYFSNGCSTKQSDMLNATKTAIGDVVVRKDIPRNKQGKVDYFYTYFKELRKNNNLEDLEKGSEGLIIRLWYDYSHYNQKQVIELKEEGGTWQSAVYTLIDQYDSNDSLLSVQKVCHSPSPKSGWASFVKQLTDLEISTLPDDDTIANYNMPMDGATVGVEVAKNNSYRFYSYSSPSYNREGMWQARNMEQIMEVIETELGVERFRGF